MPPRERGDLPPEPFAHCFEGLVHRDRFPTVVQFGVPTTHLGEPSPFDLGLYLALYLRPRGGTR